MCGCKRTGPKYDYVWTSTDGVETITYTSLLQAKAKVQRKGGSYVAVVRT